MNFVKDVVGLAKGITGGPAPDVVPKEVANGLIISTVDSNDIGYETAILDKTDTFVVERYDTAEEARVGHRTWVKKCKDGIETVTEVGYGNLVPKKEVSLIRMETSEANDLLIEVTSYPSQTKTK